MTDEDAGDVGDGVEGAGGTVEGDAEIAGAGFGGGFFLGACGNRYNMKRAEQKKSGRSTPHGWSPWNEGFELISKVFVADCFVKPRLNSRSLQFASRRSS